MTNRDHLRKAEQCIEDAEFLPRGDAARDTLCRTAVIRLHSVRGTRKTVRQVAHGNLSVALSAIRRMLRSYA